MPLSSTPTKVAASKGDKHPYSINAGDKAGTTYGTSSNGRMNSELFDLWFRHHYCLYALPACPLPHLLDRELHTISLRFVQKAAEEEAIVFCLPPYTMHCTQPKRCWREDC